MFCRSKSTPDNDSKGYGDHDAKPNEKQKIDLMCHKNENVKEAHISKMKKPRPSHINNTNQQYR